MPAQRKPLPEGFDDYGDDGSRIICRICTEESMNRKEVIIRRTSRASHVLTSLHKTALQSWSNRHTTVVEQTIEPDPGSSTVIAPSAHLQTILELMNDEIPGEKDSYEMNSWFDEFSVHGDMYIDENGSTIQFSAGEDARRNLWIELEGQMDNLGLVQHTLFAIDGSAGLDDDEQDSGVDQINAAFTAMGLDESDGEFDDEISQAVQTEEWAPHGTKTMFMLDLLDNLPRLRLSDDHLRTIMWVMRECGTPDVPSFKALREMQKSLTRTVSIEPEHHTSSLGNHFFVNHPRKLLSLVSANCGVSSKTDLDINQDWANPLVRPHIRIYPEISKSVSEFFQAEKFTKEVELDELTPMWADWERDSDRHFFVKEIAQLTDQSFIVPIKWFSMDGKIFAQAYRVQYSLERQMFDISDPELCRVECSQLHRNIRDLKTAGYRLVFSAPRWMTGDEHPLRKKSNGRPMFRIRVMPWSDDVSGNVSKQYNAHTNVYIQNVGIPHKKLQQEYFVRFCSTSQHASSSEQFVALKQDFDKDVWHEAYDCQIEQEIWFQILPHVLPADNPQQSENSSHIGVKGQKKCRRDHVGGTSTEQETDEGYCAMFCTFTFSQKGD
ncbi:hypothetical protein H0H93_011664 [Arthromyces matolae]|nr:hypothetical protein H0H93_011664 [Arthromyces matolae]